VHQAFSPAGQRGWQNTATGGRADRRVTSVVVDARSMGLTHAADSNEGPPSRPGIAGPARPALPPRNSGSPRASPMRLAGPPDIRLLKSWICGKTSAGRRRALQIQPQNAGGRKKRKKEIFFFLGPAGFYRTPGPVDPSNHRFRGRRGCANPRTHACAQPAGGASTNHSVWRVVGRLFAGPPEPSAAKALRRVPIR